MPHEHPIPGRPLPPREVTCDVVVVGARAAGAATAFLLARAGLSVVVIDRDRRGTDTLSTHALMRPAVVQLNRWGLLDEIRHSGTRPVTRTTFLYPSGEVLIDVKPSDGIDALYAPRRTVLDACLVDAAERAGATVYHDTHLRDVIRDPRGRAVGIGARDGGDHPFVIHARLVVGADGRRSTVAQLVDAPTTHAVGDTGAYVYGYWRGLECAGYEWGYGDRASAGFIPTNDGEVCVFAGAAPADMGRGGVDRLSTLVRAASDSMGRRLERAAAPTRSRTFIGQPGHLRRPWGPGWALVGDAGSWKDPSSAHGLTDALRDAELLARAVLAIADGRLGDEFGPLREYERERDRLSRPILDASAEIGTHRWTEGRLIELLWTMNEAMTSEMELIRTFEDAAVPEPVTTG